LTIACILIIVVFVGLYGQSPQQNKTPARQSKIPGDAVKVTPETDLFPPILHVDGWMQPVPLSPTVNTAGAEDSPFIMPDGNTLYFFFTPNVSVLPEKQLLDGVTGIYASKKQNGTWSTADRIMLQDSGKLALDGAEFVQGETMWFASAREGYTGVNLFTAEFKGGKWTDWQYAGDKLNKDYQVGEMHITADGNEIYFHSARAGGKGGLDIWTTRRVSGEWQAPENVAVVNTPENEGWPFVSEDGNELWFTRTYAGSPAVFVSRKVNGTWSEPELVVSQFAGEPTLDDSRNLYFVHHFYGNDSRMIEADIYVAYRR
jgi:Tol biopolymer transport system component